MTKAKTGLTLILLVVTLLCSVMPVSYAQEVGGLDKSDVMDDLFTDGTYNILDYPYNPFEVVLYTSAISRKIYIFARAFM